MRKRTGFAQLGLAFAVSMALASPAAAATGDIDRDGLSDRWEKKHFKTIKAQHGKGDADVDGLINALELKLKANPKDEDTDRDGIDDGDEVKFKTNLRDRDSDDDGKLDGDDDSDGDGVDDEDEDDALEA